MNASQTFARPARTQSVRVAAEARGLIAALLDYALDLTPVLAEHSGGSQAVHRDEQHAGVEAAGELRRHRQRVGVADVVRVEGGVGAVRRAAKNGVRAPVVKRPPQAFNVAANGVPAAASSE